MLIFTNCLTDIADEGCVKVANNLIKRLKSSSDNVLVVSYERKSSLTDTYVSSNKLLLTRDICRELKRNKQDVLYIPFPAKSIATAVRVFILSVLIRKKLRVLLTQVTDIGLAAKILFRISGADFYVLSNDTRKKIERIIGPKRTKRVKTGVQTDRFLPISQEEANELKIRYGFSPDFPVILHVGHMNAGRNISELMKISSKYQVLLVTSTLTKEEQDLQLKNQLSSCDNIKIIDDFIPNISEVYQLSDVYFFPVVEQGCCIDVPLSCLEAASCNKPVVTTDFGEMREFQGKNGFWFIESFESENINALIDEAVRNKETDTRSSVLEYDWGSAVDSILNDF